MYTMKMSMRIACMGLFLCTLCNAADVSAALPENGQVTRALTLSDLGLSEHISLSSRNFEQHFYFPVPQGVELKDAHIEIHGTYLHPFPEEAALTLLVNDIPVYTYTLPSKNTGSSHEQVDQASAVLSSGHLKERGDDIAVSLPLDQLHAQNGFLNLGIVLTSLTDSAHGIANNGHGNELSIDPKTTRLAYSFAGDSVQDIRSLLTTLPRHPLILLPQRKLNAKQYGAALRLSQGLSDIGLQPEFAAVPQVGDVVDTESLDGATKTFCLQIPEGMANAIEQHQPYKIAQPLEAAIWLALRIMSPDGLAQAVIDSEQTRRALLAALQGMDADSGLGKQVWTELHLDEAVNWLPKAALSKANVRVAMLAGQPVLTLDGDNMEMGANLIASTWRQIAGSRELSLTTPLVLPDKDSPQPHIHFALNLPVQNVLESAQWMIPIELGKLPAGKWPESFEINLMSAPSGGGQSPVVSVLMNDNLLTAVSLRTDGEITRLRAHIPLYTLHATNLLKVEIRRSSPGDMASGFPVQLLPSSYLNLRDAQEATQFFMLSTDVAHDAEIAVPARYLDDSANTLSVVSSVLRGLSVIGTDFTLLTNALPGYKPSHDFVAFDCPPASDTQQVVPVNGRLVVRNKSNHTVFDSTGLAGLMVLQLIQSGAQDGVSVTSVGGTLPALRKPLQISAGNLAIVDAGGVRLEINLDDKGNEWQLDEQNRGISTFVHRHRIWFVVLVLILVPTFALFSLRWYFRRRQPRSE